MDGWLRQSTAVTVPIGPFVDSTDGDTEETGLTIAQADVRLKKAGGAGAQKNNATSATHDADGIYDCPLSTTDTNTLGQLVLYVHVAGALFVRHVFEVVPANVWDSMYSTDLLDVNVAQFGGTNGTFASGRPEVNASHWGGTAVASAYVRATLEQILGTTVTEGAAGRIAAAFQTFFNVASSVLTTASINQTGDNYARTGAPVGASISADIAAVKTDTGNLVTRITSTIFSGITSLAQWLGAIAGKQTANSTARTEIRATGAGSGTFDETTDSMEGVRDNMGTAQTGDTYSLANGANGFVAIKADTAAILLDTGTDGVVVAAASKTGYRLSATGVDDFHDEAVDGTTTFRESTRLANSANGAKISGAATTTAVIRDLADTKDRITATVDANGNRTAITRDLT